MCPSSLSSIVSVVRRPCVAVSNPSYVFGRSPLLSSQLAKLPLGTIRPAGWLKYQLDLMVEGMTGRLSELSHFLGPENGWLGGDAEGWEEQAYWFRGFHDLAVLSGDPRCLAEARRWIEGVIGTQDADGYFGARYQKRVVGRNGQAICDLWPHMVMLDAIIHHHEHTSDPRVIPMLTRFFAFCRDLPDELFMPPVQTGYGDWKPYVQHGRAGDMLPHIFWLYNRTGEAWLLDLARRFYRRISPAQDEWLDHHIVNFTQRFAYPGIYYSLSHDPRHLALTEYWYRQHLDTWGQQPRGIFGADEQIRHGKTDPRQGFETCGMVEFAKSFYLLGQITGDPTYADRCEDIMLNHFPAAQTPDLKALHYLTAANMPQLDATEQHDFYNEADMKAGPMLPYSPHRYRCCQHNVAMGWPWYAQALWQATADNGLAAWLYAASEMTATAGDAAIPVTIRADSDYPFRGDVRLEMTSDEPVEFPLYLRVPQWCRAFSVTLNGSPLEAEAAPRGYLRIERTWARGDAVEIEMPMTVALTEWPRTGSLTVDRGPLSYSIRIEEAWRRCGGTGMWPEWEVLPASAWNYGLVVTPDNPARSLEIVQREAPAGQPWTLDTAPVEIQARGKRIPGWTLDPVSHMVQELRASPIRSDEPEETITLIPLGCARLRVSCLPAIGDGPEARTWGESGAAYGAYL
jgi:DUF1680 family protein